MTGCDLALDVECVWIEDGLLFVAGDDIGIDGFRSLEIGSMCKVGTASFGSSAEGR